MESSELTQRIVSRLSSLSYFLPLCIIRMRLYRQSEFLLHLRLTPLHTHTRPTALAALPHSLSLSLSLPHRALHSTPVRRAAVLLSLVLIAGIAFLSLCHHS